MYLPTKPKMDREAPWSDKARKSLPAKDRSRAVVYVMEAQQDGIVRVGTTTALRNRIRATKAAGVAFWAEVAQSDAFGLERSALALLQRYTGDRSRSWFNVPPEVAAGAICVAAQHMRVKFVRIGGYPGALDPSRSEVVEMLAEPYGLMPSKRRLDREEWSPQERAI